MKVLEQPQPIVLGEDFDRAFDELDGTEDMGLRFPDGRYHIYDDDIDTTACWKPCRQCRTRASN